MCPSCYPRKVLKNSHPVGGSLIKAPLHENLGHTIPKPRKCLKSAFIAFIHQGRGQWPAALQTTTSWCLLPAFYPIKAKEPWKMRGNVDPVNIYSPGRRQREGAVPCHCQQTLWLLPFPPGGEGMAQRGFGLFNTDFAVCFVTSSSSMVPTAESMAARCKNPSPRADEAHSSLLC